MKGISFEPVAHKYESIGEMKVKEWISGTRVISDFHEKFDAKAISEKSSKGRGKWKGIPPIKIREIWDSEKNRAIKLGNWYHNQREEEVLMCETLAIDGEELKVYHPEAHGELKVVTNTKLKDGIYPELMVYLESVGVCGQADLIEVVDGQVNVVDYKGLALDTPIATIDGWKEMKDINVGDIVFDINGKQTEVEHVSEKHDNPCYEIIFDSNDKIVCDNEHKWVISFLTVKGIIDKEMTTEEVFFHIKKDQGKYRLIPKIKCTQSLEINDILLPIDPYVLGVWLGDGSRESGAITNGNQDVWDEIERRGYNIGHDFSGKEHAMTRTIYNIRGILNDLGVLYHKNIPELYLRSSASQRLDLLRGFMDADGYFNNTRKRFVMATTQRWQADGISRLVSSLGWKPTIINAKKYIKERVFEGYDVCFKSDKNPFMIRNKDCMSLLGDMTHTSKFRTIKKINKIKTVTTKCITVKSNSSTYLAGFNLIPTHNSSKTIDFTSYVNWEGKSKKMFAPISHLDDCNGNHYTLQLSLYMYIILQHNPQLKPGKIVLHHVEFEKLDENEYGYPIYKFINGEPVVKKINFIKVPYLKKEIISMLKKYK